LQADLLRQVDIAGLVQVRTVREEDEGQGRGRAQRIGQLPRLGVKFNV
jgi:hypothetical protein